MDIRSDADAINLRNQLLRLYSAQEHSVDVKHGNSLRYRVVGANRFASAIASQLKAIMRSSNHGTILLQELAKLPKRIDFVEHATSHAASHDGSIVVLHNATTPQGSGVARFHDVAQTLP